MTSHLDENLVDSQNPFPQTWNIIFFRIDFFFVLFSSLVGYYYKEPVKLFIFCNFL